MDDQRYQPTPGPTPGHDPGRPFLPVSDNSERTYALFLHLSMLLGWVIGPLSIIVTLVLWLTKKDQSQYIDDHGREAMNFTISIWMYTIAASVLLLVGVGICLLIALPIFQVIVAIIGAVRANSGQFYRYPMTIRFISS